MAAHFISTDQQVQGGNYNQFSKYFMDALLGKGNPWQNETIREASVRKKADYSNACITPIHVACINPDIGPLAALYTACPDIGVVDQQHWKMVHYAAACVEAGPIEFLKKQGANLEDITKTHLTPLMIACRAGRHKTVKYILGQLSERDTDEESYMVKKFGRGRVNKPGKDSWNPLHLAVANGCYEVVKVLLDFGADANRPLNTTYDKMTPLMLAAANGDLELVKLLARKAKIQKIDRYRRTALTHAVINGSANVASYLLSRGADPNSVDSSRNSNLHYACAYGWWFCMQILLDVGADANHKNEWNLTPLSVAFLKGNKGIGKFLAELPGVDIEVRDDKGRTLLLNMLEDNGDELGKDKVNEIIAFVNDHKADPKTVDNKKRNALHYIAAYKHNRNQNAKKFMSNTKTLFHYFLKAGVSPFQADEDGNLPFSLILTNSYSWNEDEEVRPHFDLLHKVMDIMIKSCEELEGSLEEMLRKLMLDLLLNINVNYSTSYVSVFDQTNNFINLLLAKKKIISLQFMDSTVEDLDKKTSWTVFSKFCQSYRGKRFDLLNQKLSEKEKLKCFESYLSFMKRFVKTFKPRTDIEFSKNSNFNVLLLLSRAEDRFAAFHFMAGENSDIHAQDKDGRDALYILIQRSYLPGIKVLVQLGADINRLRVVYDSENKIIEKDCPLIFAIGTKNRDIISFLLKSGATVSTIPTAGSSAFLTSVSICAAERVKRNLEIVQMMLDHGANIAECNSLGRGGLHLAINAADDNPETSLDLEMLLMKNGGSLIQTDVRGRTPLHYAFVKMGNHKASTTMDPIQLVSALVDNMSLDIINVKDVFGCSALHYAAYRGSTVCVLLLLQKGANLEAKDMFGQTPVCYAVMGKHDSCTLTLIQNGANIDVEVKSWCMNQHDAGQLDDTRWKFLPDHYISEREEKPQSLFKCIILNDWLGITYIVIGKMERFGVPFAKALEVALQLQKLQFAKTLISKVLDYEKLRTVVSHGRNLANVFALETPSTVRINCVKSKALMNWGMEDKEAYTDKDSQSESSYASSCYKSEVKEEKQTDKPTSGEERRSELVEDLFSLFSTAGVAMNKADAYGFFPLHYACFKHNLVLMTRLLKTLNTEDVSACNRGKRSVLSAFFWISRKITTDIMLDLDQLLEKGFDINEKIAMPKICYPGGEFRSFNSLESFLVSEEDEVEVTCLIIAVVREDVGLLRHLIGHGADPNLSDSNGMHPLQYALKSNNEEIILELIKYTKTDMVSALDILLYAIALDPVDDHSPSFDNAKIFKKLLSLNLATTELEYETLKQKAAYHGAKSILNVLTNGKKYRPVQKLSIEAMETDSNNYDYKQEACLMMSQLVRELDQDSVVEKITPKPGCVIKEGSLHKDYDILMNKVDVNNGHWGMYNFYRIQIWKDAHKELYVLFTNWGRIQTYDNGQYQNTPFSNPEEAEEEFKKIFKSKTGNEWDDRLNFVNKPRKYRLVRTELTRKLKKSELKIDLRTSQRLELESSIAWLLKDIADPAMMKSAFTEDADLDNATIPFGRIDRKVVEKALNMLEEMEPKIKKMEKLELKRYGNNNVEKVLAELQDIGQALCSSSSEYYHLVPKPGMDCESVGPIDKMDSYLREKKRLAYILEIQTCEAMILGSMYRKLEIHPLQYISKVMGSKVTPLEETSMEAQLLMKYMYRSRGAASKRVQCIFKVGEDPAPGRPGDWTLLWHGTRRSNVLSIFNAGLIVEPLHASRAGRSYGNGIYLADVFDKSINYCDSSDNKVICISSFNHF